MIALTWIFQSLIMMKDSFDGIIDEHFSTALRGALFATACLFLPLWILSILKSFKLNESGRYLILSFNVNNYRSI